MQSSSVEWAADHDALHFATVDNFPRFADALLRRKLFVKFGFKAPAAPYSLKENRLEGEGSSDFIPWHFAAKVQCPSGLRKRCGVAGVQFSIENCDPNVLLPLDAQCSLSDVRR